MEDKDEYINSLLLSLLLIQIEINCLNKELDLAKKRELVYINNPQIEVLKEENTALKKDIKACNTCEHSTKIYGNEIAELKAENERLKRNAHYMTVGIRNGQSNIKNLKMIIQSY